MDLPVSVRNRLAAAGRQGALGAGLGGFAPAGMERAAHRVLHSQGRAPGLAGDRRCC